MKKMNFLTDWKYAHRGLHNSDYPENSIAAFENAINKGYAIEFDIRITKDNNWVVFHDKNIARMTGKDIDLNRINFNLLQQIKLNNTENYVPLLIDVLNLIDGRVPLLIEIKPFKRFKKHLLNLVKLLDNYKGEFAVFSFSPFIVNWFRKKRPTYIRGQISSFFEEKKLPRFMLYFHKAMIYNKVTKPNFISYNIKNVPNKYVSKAKRNGMLLFGFTATNKSDYTNALKYLDNVVFEKFEA